MKKDARTRDAASVESPKLAFVLNDHYERLLKLRDERPAVFEKLSTPAHTSLIYYEAAKLEFELSGQAAG
jgi:hypothetical protein